MSASYLWWGGEDVDFPSASVTTTTSAGLFRSAFARCAISVGSGVIARAQAMPGGAVTSCWYTFRVNAGVGAFSAPALGLCSGSTNKGIIVGRDASFNVTLWKFDGTTLTSLAVESGASMTSGLHKVDVQLVNYGASSIINVWIDQAQVINFTGDCTVSGVSNLDTVFLRGGNAGANVSEIIVSTDDTRGIPGLWSFVPAGAGSTTDFSNNTFSNVNGTSWSDLNPAYSNSVGQIQLYTTTTPPGGTYNVGGVKIVGRVAVSPGATPTKIDLGYKDGATVSWNADHTPSTAYQEFEDYNLTNPNGGGAWTTAVLGTLQIGARAQ